MNKIDLTVKTKNTTQKCLFLSVCLRCVVFFLNKYMNKKIFNRIQRSATEFKVLILCHH